MNKVDPIIAVKNVPLSSQWYQQVFSCKSTHGGGHFDVLEDEKGEVMLCLHQWGNHDHPTMIDPVQPGNGLILYLRTDRMEEFHARAAQFEDASPSEIQVNPNTGKREFSVVDPDGYFWIVSEAHTY